MSAAWIFRGDTMSREKQETLVLFPDIISITENFTNDQFGELMRAVFSYRFNGQLYTGKDGGVDVAFRMVKSQIDRYTKICETNSQNRKDKREESNDIQGNPTESQEIQGNPPHIHTHTPIHTHSHKDIDSCCAAKPPKRTEFVPPTVDDVRNYCKENSYSIDPECFVNYYTSNGWLVGKNKMKDWKAAVRTWQRKEKENDGTTESKPIWHVGIEI